MKISIHKIYFTVLLLISCIVGGLSPAKAQLDSKGTDFWLMFNSNFSPPTLTLFITSSVNTSGTVSGPSFAPIPFTVTANTVTPVVVPTSLASHVNDVKDNKGIHITALNDVTVYGLNYVPFTTDAYLGLPTDVLGTEYLIVAYTGIGRGTEFGIVGTVNGTVVTITPTATVGSHTAGVPYNITLNQGETYELVTGTTDLTGTVITSTQPIGVMGAAQCANIPNGFSFCDHICEMIPPTSTWGKKFVTVPLASRTSGDTWRFVASENNTVVTINGVPRPPINRGQFIETVLTVQSIIESDKPILVAQFANGSQFSGNPGDPFMMLIPPFEQFLPGYTLTTVSGYVSHYINIVAPNAVVGSLTLDGVPVPAASFTAIGSSGFSGAQVKVTDGSHTLSASLPFGAFQYGFNVDDSYGYPGGQSFAPVATVSNIAIAPKSSVLNTGNPQCFTATVKDQFNAPVAGVRVDFNITGPNSALSGFAFTDAGGVAPFCYTGTAGGKDTVMSVVGTLRDTAIITWNALQDSCEADQELPVITCPAMVNVCVNTTATYTIDTLTATDNCGIESITYMISGATTRSGTGNDASGLFNEGVSTITWTVTDKKGNQSTCSTIVKIWPLPVAHIKTSTPDDFCNKLTLMAGATNGEPVAFAWSLGNMAFAATKNIQLDNTNSDGTYKVLVTDSNGCQSPVPATYVYQKQNVISNYTILANKSSRLDDNNKVQTGSVGVMKWNGLAKFGRHCAVAAPGAFVKAKYIITQHPVNIPNKIFAPATVTLPTMQYNTTSTAGLPSHIVNAFANVTLTGNYKNLEIKKGAVVTLKGTIFGRIIIHERAKVTFTQPVINIRELFVNKGSEQGYTYVYFATDASVRVSQHVKIQERVSINPDSAKVTFYLGDTPCDEQKFMVKANDTRVIANVYIPNGDLKIVPDFSFNCGWPLFYSKPTYMTGLFIAEEIQGDGENVIWNNYHCKSESETPLLTDARIAQPQVADQVVMIPAGDHLGRGLEVTASPNPSSTSFRITVNSSSHEPVTIRVTDALGRLLESRNGIRPGSTITLGAGLMNGLYYVEINQHNQRKIVKLVKTK